MDKLPALGTAISQVLMPTYQVYMPLLLKQADNIKLTKRESFTYGSHPRQQLDVYTPVANAALQTQNTVFVFLYGGGLVRGDKINPNAPQGLVYANVGHFFAEALGCKVVIPDYRLISHGAKYPSGGEDLELVIEWIKANVAHDSAKPLNLFMMGNSAGGIHLATYLLAPQFTESRQKILDPNATDVRLGGVALLAAPFHFGQPLPDRVETLKAYYGVDTEQHVPLGLLRAMKEDGSLSTLGDVPVLIITGTLDPHDEILAPNNDFVKEWRSAEVVSRNLSEIVMDGHNHISPCLALGTGIANEEQWGRQVVQFIQKATPK